LLRRLVAAGLLALAVGWGTARAEAPVAAPPDTGFAAGNAAPADTAGPGFVPVLADTGAGGEAFPPPARMTPGAKPMRPLRRGPSPGGAALRSFILPGWGQAANHKWVKTVLFLGAYSGFWASSISFHQDRMDAVGGYNAAVTDSARSYWKAKFDRATAARNGKYWMAGLTLVLAMADAYVDAALANFDQRMDADVGFVPTSEDPVLGVRLTMAWDGTDTRASRRDRAR